MEARDPLKRNNVAVFGNLSAERTMLFGHGFGTDQTVWREVAAPFLNDFRVIVFDNVGAGQSAPEAFVQHRYLNLNAYAADLLDICHALQIRNGIYIGHSVGATIGVLAAIREPGTFAKLILIGASPRYLDDQGYRGELTWANFTGLLRLTIRHGPTGSHRWPWPTLTGRTWRNISPIRSEPSARITP